MHRLNQVPAALLLALVAVTAVLPLATASGGRRGCHCVVRMMCCEDGTCTMGGDEPPAAGPEWRTCRREAPATATAIDAFERALTESSGDRDRRNTSNLAAASPASPRFTPPIPATPPPR